MNPRLRGILLLAAGLGSLAAVGPVEAEPEWHEAARRAGTPPALPVRPFQAEYRFGWEGIESARGKVRFIRTGPDRYRFLAETGTIGAARTLWAMDATHDAVLEGKALLTRHAIVSESYRGKQIRTRLDFSRDSVVRNRTVTVRGRSTGTPKRFALPAGRDLAGAWVWLTHQSLDTGDRHRLAVFPGADPCLVEARVAGRETVRIGKRELAAFRVEIDLREIRKNGTLAPFRKFRRARAWISDSPDRLLLRAEADVFIGSVFAEIDPGSLPKQPVK